MAEQSGRGCLGALFGVGGTPSRDPALPEFRVRADFLSATELSFFHAAKVAVGDRFLVHPKVNLADIFFSPSRSVSDRNRIDRKHVDFLICDAVTYRPVLGIELDDASHEGQKARKRDAVKDAAFESAGLPLLRLKARRSYGPTEIAAAVDAILGGRSAETAEATELEHAPVEVDGIDVASTTPACPSCGAPMVLRPARAGKYESFYGCSNYPRCRGIRPIRADR